MLFRAEFGLNIWLTKFMQMRIILITLTHIDNRIFMTMYLNKMQLTNYVNEKKVNSQ